MEIKTSCVGCVFLKETNCKLGRYEKFKSNGATIELENGFPLVNGRFCSAKRPEKWMEGKSKVNLPLIIRAELLVNYEAIIHLEHLNPEELQKTLDSLANQLVKPKTICINSASQDIHYSQLIKQLQKLSLPFRVDRVTKGTHYLEAIDVSVSKAQTDYYFLIESGAEVDSEYVANIDEAINVEMKRFLVVTGEGKIGSFVNTQLHKNLDGNYPTRAKKLYDEEEDEGYILETFEQKVEYLAQKRNQEYLIKNYREIVNG